MMAGLLMAIASVGYGVVAIALKLAGLPYVPGYASLLVTITFLSGVQLIVIGMVGQYVARIYDEARGRPLYLVRETRGLAGGGDDDDRPAWSANGDGPLARGAHTPGRPAN
jgi:dolichol-phosphate mannosyltransferase